jgi:hypothetical protein
MRIFHSANDNGLSRRKHCALTPVQWRSNRCHVFFSILSTSRFPQECTCHCSSQSHKFAARGDISRIMDDECPWLQIKITKSMSMKCLCSKRRILLYRLGIEFNSIRFANYHILQWICKRTNILFSPIVL